MAVCRTRAGRSWPRGRLPAGPPRPGAPVTPGTSAQRPRTLRRPAGLGQLAKCAVTEHPPLRRRPPLHDHVAAEGGAAVPRRPHPFGMNYTLPRWPNGAAACPATWVPGPRRSWPPGTTPLVAGVLRQVGAAGRELFARSRPPTVNHGRGQRPSQRRPAVPVTGSAPPRPAGPHQHANQAGLNYRSKIARAS